MHVDLLSDGRLLLALNDGREALVRDEDVIECAEQTKGFESVEELKRQANEAD